MVPAPRVSHCLLIPLTLLVALLPPPARLNHSILAASPIEGSLQLPAGLILPVRLDDSLELHSAAKGSLLEGHIMQEVPLLGREKISIKALVKASVLNVTKDSDGTGISITLAFAHLTERDQTLPITTSLRAIASYSAVRKAQTPYNAGPDGGTPAGWANTIQIGGDIRFGDGGPVRNRHKQKVGKGVLGGVLVHLQANPALGCEGPLNGDDRLQALWVFSADACGVYGLNEIKIAHSGKSEPVGQITLHFEKSDAKMDAGTALLLRVVARP